MSPVAILLLFLGIFLVLAMCFKIPVGYSIGISTFILIVANGISLTAFNQALFTSIDSVGLTAVPFYIFAGTLMQYSGIAESLVNMIQAWIGRIRGSLGAVVVVASLAFGVLTGSTAATISAIGGILIKPMHKNGYTPKYAGALVASCGFLGVLIPPSIQGILLAQTAGLKVTDVWLSTIGSGLLVGLGYIALNFLKRCKVEEKNTEPFVFKSYMANGCKATINSFWALLMPVIIFGGIYSGVMTATEAGAVSCLYGLIFYLVRKHLTKKGKKEVQSDVITMTAKSSISTAAIACILYFSGAASRLISISGVANWAAEVMTKNISSPMGFMVIATILLLIAGCFLDNTVSIQIFTPLLIPTVHAYGINTSYFAAVALLALSIGQITPPFAGSLFVGAKVAGVSFNELVSEIWPFIGVTLVVMALVVAFPQISLFLL